MYAHYWQVTFVSKVLSLLLFSMRSSCGGVGATSVLLVQSSKLSIRPGARAPPLRSPLQCFTTISAGYNHLHIFGIARVRFNCADSLRRGGRHTRAVVGFEWR